MVADEARRAVLSDLGNALILPALRDFASSAELLSQQLDALASSPEDAQARAAAQAAWRAAVEGFEAVEVLQLGPAARSDAAGGEDLRDLIYAYPSRVLFQIDCRALDEESVDAQTRIDAMGLGALEHLLFNAVDADAQAQCGSDSVDVAAARAAYAARIGAFINTQATTLRDRWEPAQGNFLATWSDADNAIYSKPQDALDALSTALFYVEKDTKDRKIACPTGIGATGLVCTGNDVSKVEFPFAQTSLSALRVNVQTFRDAMAGPGNAMGLNALLRGIGRDDIADKILQQLDVTLTQLDTQFPDGFEAAIAAIDDQDACINASSSRQGEPVACALHGQIKAAMDTFRTEVVAALSLATPDRAAGDND